MVIRTVRMKTIITPRGRTCTGGGSVREEGRVAPFSARAPAATALWYFHSELKRVARAGRARHAEEKCRVICVCIHSVSSHFLAAQWQFVGPVWCSCARCWRWLAPAGVHRSRRMFRRKSAAPDARPGASLCTWLNSPPRSDTSRYLQPLCPLFTDTEVTCDLRPAVHMTASVHTVY